MKRYTIPLLIILLITFGVTSVDFSDKHEKLVTRYIELSGLVRTISRLPEQVVEISGQRILESSDPKTEQEIANIMVESFDTELAEKTLRTYILIDSDTDSLKEMISWLETPLMKKITAEENFSFQPEFEDELLQYIRGLETSPPPKDRINIMKDFVNTTFSVNTAANITSEIMLGFIKAENHKLPEYDRLDKFSLEKEFIQVRNIIRNKMSQQMILFGLYTYRNISDDELIECLNFYKSVTGRKIVGATSNAIIKAAKQYVAHAEKQVAIYFQNNRQIVNLSLEEENQLVIKAKQLLDNWFGQDEILVEAKAIIDKVLASNPNKYEAYTELARFYIMAGSIVKPGKYVDNTQISLEKAEKALNKAIAINPDYGDGYVLFGHLYINQKKYDLAANALRKAEKLTKTNPWLYMNWADLFERQGKIDEALEKVNLALQIKTVNKKVQAASYDMLIKLFQQKKDYEKVNELYKKYIDFESSMKVSYENMAWSYGNYSYFLRNYIGDFDEALKYALKSSEIMDYGIGRLNIALAYYLKWAETLEGSSHTAKAEEYFNKAYGVLPDLDTALLYLGRYDKTQMAIRPLIDKGASIDATRENGDTALYGAAYDGHYEAVKNLLALGADPNHKSEKGFTPFFIAIYMGHTDIVQLMLEYNAKDFMINDRDALATARYRNHADIVRVLNNRQLDI
jgi:tetratricopeptide (TPR) repeat protein